MPPGSEDKLRKYWPEEDETAYTREAAAEMTLAQQVREYGATAQQKQTYVRAEMRGMAPDELARLLGIDIGAINTNADQHEVTAGWLTQGHGEILTYKNALIAAYTNYKAQMSAAATQGSILGVIRVNDKIETEFRQACDSAKSGYDKGRDVIAEGQAAGKQPPVKGPGGTKITDARPVDGAARSGVNPNLFDPSTGGYSSPAQGAGSNTPGGGTSAGGTSAGGPAGGGLSSGGSSAADLGGGSSGAGLGSGSGSSSGAGGPTSSSPMGGGMPMGGMPMQGMQPPQMPQMPGGGGQTPGGDLAKTGADMVTKLAGADKGAGGAGVPVTPEQLDKLLSKQGDGAGGLGGEKGDGPTAEGPDGKGDKKLNGSATSTSGATVNGPGGGNGAAGAGAHPAAPAGPPSPAAPVTTHAPAAPAAAPMTELSADETPAGQQRPQDQQHHTAPAGNAQSTSASMAPFPGPPPAAVQTQGAGTMVLPPMATSLGTYSQGALGAGNAAPTPAPLPPVLAPFTTAGRHTADPAVVNYAVAEPEPEYVARIASLPGTHALAHTMLAQTLAPLPARGWVTTAAIGVLEPAVEGPPPLYVLATADALSLLPAGAQLPAGAYLIADFAPDSAFMDRWGGYQHPAAIVAAFATSPWRPPGYALAYLLSSETSTDKAGRYATGVSEVVQNDEEAAWLLLQGPVGARPRHSSGGPIAPHRAADALAAFGEVWRVTDATIPEWAAADLWAARWRTTADHELDDYPAALARYLHADAHAALLAGDLHEAAYALGLFSVLEPKPKR